MRYHADPTHAFFLTADPDKKFIVNEIKNLTNNCNLRFLSLVSFSLVRLPVYEFNVLKILFNLFVDFKVYLDSNPEC